VSALCRIVRVILDLTEREPVAGESPLFFSVGAEFDAFDTV